MKHRDAIAATRSAEKEIKRLNAKLAELSSSQAGGKAKRLYYDEKSLAKRWSMSVKHVQKLRYTKAGPKVTRFGRSVRYRLRDILAYEGAMEMAKL